MKYAVKLSPMAVADLDSIYEYIKEQLKSPMAAENTVEGILNAIQILETFPESGTMLYFSSDLASGYRYVVYKNYLAFYRFSENDVFVDRIIYGRRDYMSILFGNMP